VVPGTAENVGRRRAVLAVVADAGLGVIEGPQLPAGLVLRGQRIVGRRLFEHVGRQVAEAQHALELEHGPGVLAEP